MLQPFGFKDSVEFFRSYIQRACLADGAQVCRCISLGCGDGGPEISIAEWLVEQGFSNFNFECCDLNPEVLSRGEKLVREMGLSQHFTFKSFDVNSWTPERKYDIVLACQSLHHVLELEHLFGSVREALRPEGYFLVDDMIGRNGHQRWPEALKLIHELWKELPARARYNHQQQRIEEKYENWDCSREGFEGIRSQDVLPLLIDNFHFDVFIGFGNLIDIFIDRAFGHNFDPASQQDTDFIDRVHGLDIHHLEAGTLTPTHIIAALSITPVARPRFYKHLTPQFCVRIPR